MSNVYKRENLRVEGLGLVLSNIIVIDLSSCHRQPGANGSGSLILCENPTQWHNVHVNKTILKSFHVVRSLK